MMKYILSLMAIMTVVITVMLPFNAVQGAINFSGGAAHGAASTTGDRLGVGNLTITYWMYIRGSGQSNSGTIISNNWAVISVKNTTNVMSLTRNGATSANTSPHFLSDVASNTWEFMAVTSDNASPSNVNWFVSSSTVNLNVSRTGAINASGGNPTPGTTTAIGNDIQSPHAFNGCIADLRVYNVILTQAQINSISHGGNIGIQPTLWIPFQGNQASSTTQFQDYGTGHSPFQLFPSTTLLTGPCSPNWNPPINLPVNYAPLV